MRMCCAALGVVLSISSAHAAFIDWTGVTLSGSNPYTFTDPTLGLVTITYSGNYKNEGIIDIFGSTDTLGLGETGPNHGIVTLSWEQPITSLDIRLYDLDLSEYDDLTIEPGTTLSLVAANPLGPANPLSGLRVSGSAAGLSNGAIDNYTTVRISGGAFTSFGVDFTRPGAGGGGHSIGFGDPILPAPADAGVLAMIGVGLLRRRRR